MILSLTCNLSAGTQVLWQTDWTSKRTCYCTGVAAVACDFTTIQIIWMREEREVVMSHIGLYNTPVRHKLLPQTISRGELRFLHLLITFIGIYLRHKSRRELLSIHTGPYQLCPYSILNIYIFIYYFDNSLSDQRNTSVGLKISCAN